MFLPWDWIFCKFIRKKRDIKCQLTKAKVTPSFKRSNFKQTDGPQSDCKVMKLQTNSFDKNDRMCVRCDCNWKRINWTTTTIISAFVSKCSESAKDLFVKLYRNPWNFVQRHTCLCSCIGFLPSHIRSHLIPLILFQNWPYPPTFILSFQLQVKVICVEHIESSDFVLGVFKLQLHTRVLLLKMIGFATALNALSSYTYSEQNELKGTKWFCGWLNRNFTQFGLTEVIKPEEFVQSNFWWKTLFMFQLSCAGDFYCMQKANRFGLAF